MNFSEVAYRLSCFRGWKNLNTTVLKKSLSTRTKLGIRMMQLFLNSLYLNTMVLKIFNIVSTSVLTVI